MSDAANMGGNSEFAAQLNPFLPQDITPKKLLSRKFIRLSVLSIQRYLFTRYMAVLLGVGGYPLVIAILMGIVGLIKGKIHFGAATADPAQIMKLQQTFQIIFRIFYIHFSIFFVASIFGFSLLRKEMDDQTLHYLFLQPISKTTIILSKFMAYIILSWLYLSIVFTLTYLLAFSTLGLKTLVILLFEKGKIWVLLQEVFVMFLALLIYGSIAMVMGSLFKSGFYGAIFYFWETALPYLPSTLKYFTISHYLQALTPEKSFIPEKLFQLFGTLPSAWFSIVVLMFIFLIFLGLTAIIIRFYECRYS